MYIHIYIYEYGSLVCGLGNCGLGKMLESTRNYGGFHLNFCRESKKQKGSLQNSKIKGHLGVKKAMEVKCKRICTV